jgi:aminopeptidase N
VYEYYWRRLKMSANGNTNQNDAVICAAAALQVVMPAMIADAQAASSHPVLQCHNGDVDKIISSFDILTYAKAASVLRMLSLCVGLDCFVLGLR